MFSLCLRVAVAIGLCAIFYLAAPAALAETPTQPFASTGLEEIVVTARRREENLQNVPVAVTALSGTQLQSLGIQRAEDLQRVAPSLTVSQDFTSRQNANFTIRGQGRIFNGDLPSVVTYFNEMPLDANGGADFALFDLQSAQVLRGPQGTLFGRNANGGAVLLTPKAPGKDYEGDLDVSFGNYAYRDVKAGVTLPINEMLSLRISGDYDRRNGYTRNIATGQEFDNVDQGSWRLFLRFQPNEFIRNDLIYQGLRADETATASIYSNIRAVTIVGFPPSALYQAAFARQQMLGPRTVDTNAPGQGNWRNVNLIVDTLSVNLTDKITFKNIASFEHAKVCYGDDLSGEGLFVSTCRANTYSTSTTAVNAVTGAPVVFSAVLPDADYKIYNEEARLQGTAFDDSLNWQGGAFFSSTKMGDLNTFNIRRLSWSDGGQSPQFSGNASDDKSYALYAQATQKLDPLLKGLSLTAGIRNTWDDRASAFGQYFSNGTAGATYICNAKTAAGVSLPPGTPLSQCFSHASDTFHGYSYTVGPDWKVTDNLLLYAKTSRGYKAGGFNVVSTSAAREYQPETEKDFEVGAKTEWTLGTIVGRFNADYWHAYQNNIQRQVTAFVPGGVGVVITTNPRGQTQGIEAETTINFTRQLSLSGYFAWSQGRYSFFEDNDFVSPTLHHDVSGSLWLGLPRMAGSLTTAYDQPLPGLAGDVVASVTEYRQSREATNSNTVDNPESIEGGYSLLSARLEWRKLLGSSVDFALWGNNLTNRLYGQGGAAIGALVGITGTVYGPPRMFGGEVIYHFGPGQDSGK